MSAKTAEEVARERDVASARALVRLLSERFGNPAVAEALAVSAITAARADGHAAGVAEERGRVLAKIDARIAYVEEDLRRGGIPDDIADVFRERMSELRFIRDAIAAGEKP
jgi:uncharacterized sporulation protein YeaH/YhbH (DUF444 family)